MKLSLCIATYNEETNLHYPLDSAYNLVDEVIVVDGGSTDKTIQIAKSYGNKVKIIQTNNPPMFHINKQKALDAAGGEWILQLDADEALTDELKQEIKNVIHRNDQLSIINNQQNGFEIENSKLIKNLKLEIENLPVAYNLPRKNWFINRFLMKGGQYPDYTIRLYRNGAARFPCKDVHENVGIISQKSKVKGQNYNLKVKSRENVIPVQTGIQIPNQFDNNKSKIGYLKSPILHYSDPTFKRYWNRWKRYTTLEAEHFVGAFTPKKPSLINYIFIKPIVTFFLMYFRHKGFMDGWAGFVFALFSSIRFWGIYFKYKVKSQKSKVKLQL